MLNIELRKLNFIFTTIQNSKFNIQNLLTHLRLLSQKSRYIENILDRKHRIIF